MNDDIEILKKINIENKVWIIYLIIIGLSFYSNSIEERYVKYKNPDDRRKHQNLIILIFSIVLVIYYYFFLDNYRDVINLGPYDSEKKKNLNKASLLASTLVLISGIIFLTLAILDDNMDVELAFN